MRGKLFTRDFLTDGILQTTAWQGLDPGELERFEKTLRDIMGRFPVTGTPNESTTEQDLIYPVLEALGWSHRLSQQTTSGRGRRNVPDLLLFLDEAAKKSAQSERREADRYKHGKLVLEAKRWERPLDRGAGAELQAQGTPSTQMLRYLSRAEVVSGGAVRWGVLTNGRLWRLYWQGARSRSEEFLELDLAALSGVRDVQLDLDSTTEEASHAHFLRVFFLVFRRDSFLPQPEDPEGRTFHGIALEESRRWEERVSTDLGRVVFENVFPELLQALLTHDREAPTPPTPEYLEELRRAALTFLYRLLFVLYAEDRNLLPAHDSRYDDYSLRKIRQELKRRLDERDSFSERATNFHSQLQGLFTAVGEGDTGIGLPPYDGGLFEAEHHDLLERTRVPDAALAPLIDALSRREVEGKRLWINYRDLSVQQLGSIYERLLEFEPSVDEEGRVHLRPNLFARKTSGSYYTHDDLVRLILEQAIGPLIEEITTAFHEANERLVSDRRAKENRLDELKALDPASKILDLQVCDPAMGSGHFLVSLVDYLADQVLEHMAEAEAEVDWAPDDQPYRSPLSDRIEAIRAKIRDNAQKEDWLVREDDLDDRHIVRRIILKRVIYGVDKNPMAVELAKVALWLHTFTTGAPLSFLDHHLRCGDSLYGEWLDDVQDQLERVSPLFLGQARARIASAAEGMNKIARISDDDIAEVHQSQEYFQDAEEELTPLRHLLDLWQARRWFHAAPGKSGEHPGFAPLIRGALGDLMEALEAGRVEPRNPEQEDEAAAVNELLARTRELAKRERFLHWELAFPTVWKRLGQKGRSGGFDAVIGNPPWDRLKLQEVEWFAAREPDIARSARASDRKKKIRALAKKDAPLWESYLVAKEAAETAAKVARESDSYPLLARGDINIYSLFVERGESLVKPEGIVGFLVPSGIASDKTSSTFFRGISTSGRLRTLFDFENKKVFFPDVHASFKFAVLVIGGPQRTFEEAQCAFFLHSVDELEEFERVFPLGPDDFAAVNPNTGTAPIFRSQRDAEITTGIYKALLVLVDRSDQDQEPVRSWPVDYTTMFHMTNDSHLFKTREELEQEGFYPVEGNRWKKGDRLVLPLYVGRLIHQFDHRAASVVVNPDNVHNVAYSQPTTLEEHQDLEFTPTPQYWVDTVETRKKGYPGDWALAFRDIARSTDERTLIAALVPTLAAGNTLPLLLPLPSAEDDYADFAPLMLAQLNSFIVDFVMRQKIQSTHANWYIMEQLPLLSMVTFDEKIGSRGIGDFVRSEVLRLTYTAIDMEPFARDMGYEGEPFPWDEEDRRHRRARLDALFFQLYGVSRSDADYILQQFPIVRDDDEKVFGRYLTRDLILAYMNAVAAGDLETRVRV